MYITCQPPCVCAPSSYTTHATVEYTFIHRSLPVWVQPANGVCDIRFNVSSLFSGRVALMAATLSAPLAGNKSVDTDSLYHITGTAVQ